MVNITEEKLRYLALELDSYLAMFESRYLYFVDTYDKKQTPQEVAERDRACVAFYRLRDLVYSLSMKSTELAEDMRMPEKTKGAETQRPQTRLLPETAKPQYNVSESESDGMATIVSRLGAVRIINSNMGNLISSSDLIAVCCGSKTSPTEWMKKATESGYKINILRVNLSIPSKRKKRKDGSKANINVSMNFVTEREAEKIIKASGCAKDRTEWVRKNVFGFCFNPRTAKIPMSSIEPQYSKKKPPTSSKKRANSVSYRNGELYVNWS